MDQHTEIRLLDESTEKMNEYVSAKLPGRAEITMDNAAYGNGGL